MSGVKEGKGSLYPRVLIEIHQAITEIGKILGSVLAKHLVFPALSFTGTTAVDLWLRIRDLWLPDQRALTLRLARDYAK